MPNSPSLWATHYGAMPPLAHLLREAGEGGWLRVHTLPNAKRYAETEAETAEVFHRTSEVGDTVLGRDARCQLIVAQAGGERQAAAYEAARKTCELLPTGWFNDPDDDDLVWSIYTAEVHWSADTFAPLLHAIAADQVAHVLWIGESGSVFAPYDGGMDVFIRPIAAAEPQKARFADWMSRRSDGL